jgi:hypothetical protein
MCSKLTIPLDFLDDLFTFILLSWHREVCVVCIGGLCLVVFATTRVVKLSVRREEK